MQMVEKARWAAASYATYPRAAVMPIVAAVAKAAAAEARRYAEWAVEETGFGVVEHKELKNRLCSVGLYEHYADRELHRLRRRRGDEDRGDPEAGRRDLRADAVDQPGLLGLLQGDPRAPHPERDRDQPAPGGEGLLRRRGAAGQPRGGRGRCARRHRPGHRQPDAADHREGDELGPDRPDPRHRRLADGARRLFIGQSGDRRRARQQPGLCRRDRGRGQGGQGDRRFEGLRQLDPLHQRVGGDRPRRRSPGGSPRR